MVKWIWSFPCDDNKRSYVKESQLIKVFRVFFKGLSNPHCCCYSLLSYTNTLDKHVDAHYCITTNKLPQGYIPELQHVVCNII